MIARKNILVTIVGLLLALAAAFGRPHAQPLESVHQSASESAL